MITQTDSKMKALRPQEQKVVAWIYENGSATVRDIFIYCNINSPRKVLSDLRAKDLIEDVWVTRTNADGETVRFKRYYLRGAA